MRLNIFLPFRKRPGKDASSRPGGFRRVLGVLGPTWTASPVRRLVQVATLALFLLLFFYVCWPYGSTRHAEAMQARERIEAELFLALDPLVSISTALAAKLWVWSLAWAGGLLAVSLAWPRAFCGYLCPLGTLIDLFDGTLGRLTKRLRLQGRGWWVHLKYYVLVAVLAGAAGGVLLSIFFAAIAVLTRGMLFTAGWLQIGLLRGGYQVPPMAPSQWISIALFAGVFAVGFLRPRFWCRHLCPTGAVFAATSPLRLVERRVDAKCIACNQCVETCPLDAIHPDFSTRHADCTFCQTCGGICPVEAISFTTRWTPREPAAADAASKSGSKPQEKAAAAGHVDVSLSRRGFLAGAAAGLATTALAYGLMPAFDAEGSVVPVRPPGSVPESSFLQLCIACGECIKACPNNVLQPMGFEHGLAGVWTPRVAADWAGCDPSCNICGQVCPTGAIRALSLEEKRVAHMGLAVVSMKTCLPWAGREDCQMCYDECRAAGYNAIEFERTRVETDDFGLPVEDTGFSAPNVLAEKCVGCGLCQTRCYVINVKSKHLLEESAITICAGPGREDRLLHGSYRELREAEQRRREEERKQHTPDVEYNPNF